MAKELSKVLWTEEHFELAEIVKTLNHNLSVIAKTIQDYKGDDDTLHVKKDTILCFSGIGIQKRAVAYDKNRRSLSIPLDYPFHFEVKTCSGFTKPKSLCDILDLFPLPVTLRFDSHVAVDICLSGSGAAPLKADQFGELEVKLVYEEKFLQGAYIEGDTNISSNYIVMPCHHNIKMKMGKGVKGQNAGYWDTFKARFELQPSAYSHPALQGNYHIFVFNGQTDNEKQIYANIQSSNYGLLRVHSVSANDGAIQRLQSHDSGFDDSCQGGHLSQRSSTGSQGLERMPSELSFHQDGSRQRGSGGSQHSAHSHVSSNHDRHSHSSQRSRVNSGYDIHSQSSQRSNVSSGCGRHSTSSQASDVSSGSNRHSHSSISNQSTYSDSSRSKHLDYTQNSNSDSSQNRHSDFSQCIAVCEETDNDSPTNYNEYLPSLAVLDAAARDIEIASHIYDNDTAYEDRHDYENIDLKGLPFLPPDRKRTIAPPSREDRKLDNEELSDSVPALNQHPNSAQTQSEIRQHPLPPPGFPANMATQTILQSQSYKGFRKQSDWSLSDHQTLPNKLFHRNEDLPLPTMTMSSELSVSSMHVHSPPGDHYVSSVYSVPPTDIQLPKKMEKCKVKKWTLFSKKK